MAEKKKKLTDVFDSRGGRFFCKLCADYDTQLEGKARRHAQVKHMVDLEPVVVVTPKRGVPVDEFKYEEK